MAKKTEFSAERKTELRRQVLAEIDKAGPAGKKAPVKAEPIAAKPETMKKAAKKIKIAPIKAKLSGMAKKTPLQLSLPPLSRRIIKQTKIKLKNPVLTAVSAAVILAVLILVVDILGIYRFGWQDVFSRQVANIVPLPAGSVNGKMIRLSDYFSDVKTMNLSFKNDREGVDGIVIGANLGEKIFNRLALNTLIARKLKDYNQSLSQPELNQAWSGLVNASGEKQIKESIKNIYGLNENQFKEKVLKPLLMKEKLQAVVTQDENLKINQEARKKAGEVLTLALQPGVDFSVLAGQYTQDEAGINTGGDLGWISRGEASLELETALFSLAPGAVFEEIIKNKAGYHIIKAETKLTDKDTGKESARARQILIKVDVNQYLKDLLAQARLKKFVK